MELWRSRFGIPTEAFEGYAFHLRGHNVWISSSAELPDLRYETIGVRFMSTKGQVWKPTTSALQLFGGRATKNTIDLDPDQAKMYLAGESQSLGADLENGYVVVSYRGMVLGCGLYSRGELVSQLPKERRIMSDKIENGSFKGDR